METEQKLNAEATSRAFLDAMIRFGLVLLMAGYCLRVFTPFASIMIWGLIMAVALYPVHQKIASKLGNKQGRASAAMIIVALVGLGVPLFFVGDAFVGQVLDLRTAVVDNTLEVRPPADSVAEWPLIGEKVHKAWTSANQSLSQFLKDYDSQIKDVSKWLLTASASTFGSVLQLLVSFIVAGIMMAYGEPGKAAAERICNRLVGQKSGRNLQVLCTATVRSVAVGVLGVAFLQALLFGIGFIIGGIPAAGVLALITLILGIVQIPALLVGLPAIIYLWTSGDASTVFNALMTLYFIVASLADNVLKPMLLGRGVEAPMPVILLGALGGMVAYGFIGLFIGAVILAVGYKVFMAWVD